MLPQWLNDFLKEMLNRLMMKSPRFFKVLRLIMGATALVGYTPTVLNWLGAHTSEAFVDGFQKFAIFVSGMFATTYLPTQSRAVVVTTEGDVLKKTNEDKLPFTAKNEQANIRAQNLEVVDIPTPPGAGGSD